MAAYWAAILLSIDLASAQFVYDETKLKNIQAFHFKGGQGAKTGTGGHLPEVKDIGKSAEVRGIEAGIAAISPSTFNYFLFSKISLYLKLT